MKLTEANVKTCIELDKLGISRSKISEYSGISKTMVQRILQAVNLVKDNKHEEIKAKMDKFDFGPTMRLVSQMMGYEAPEEVKEVEELPVTRATPPDNTAEAMIAVLRKLDIICAKLDYLGRLWGGDKE